jgi:peptide/nickel transport system substrate-binding protein
VHVLRRIAVVVALALVATACGGDDNGDGTASQSTEPAATANPNAELKVGFTDDLYITQGPDANMGVYPLNTNVVETLILLTPDYKLQPLLAERWEFRPPNTWRFVLRRGVTFSDGQPVNAQAVKTGLFDRVSRRTGGGTIKAGPNSAVVVDDYTIDFTPTVNNYRVPEQIVHPQNGVYAPGSDPGSRPVGTGPFTFVEYLPKERIVVQRNPNYWGPTKAGVARMTMRFYPDANARRLALEAGDIDVAYQIPGPDVKGLKSRGLNVMNSPVGAYEAMYANIHGTGARDFLADVNVRKAVALAIDRKQLVDGVLEGQGTQDQTVVPPASLGQYASTIKGFTFDPNQAKTLLDQAGWRPGSDGIRAKGDRRLKLVMISGFPTAAVHRPIPTFIQSQLRDVGIDLEIQETPDDPSYTAALNEKRGDLYLEQGNQNDANVAFLPSLLFYTGPEGGGGSTYQPIVGPGGRFDELLKPVFTEPDNDKLRSHVANAMHEIIDVQTAVIPLHGVFRIYGLKQSVKGFTPHASFLNVRWEGVTMAA